MDEMDDLGAKFARDKSFCFDYLVIKDIIFDDTSDVTLYCNVPYYGRMYFANFGLTFEQLNILLRSTKSNGSQVATALAEKLDGEIQVPSVLDLEQLFGKPLVIDTCILYTTLYSVNADVDIADEEDEDLEDDEEEEDEEEGGADETETEDGEDYYEAFAFLIEGIVLKYPEN